MQPIKPGKYVVAKHRQFVGGYYRGTVKTCIEDGNHLVISLDTKMDSVVVISSRHYDLTVVGKP